MKQRTWRLLWHEMYGATDAKFITPAGLITLTTGGQNQCRQARPWRA